MKDGGQQECNVKGQQEHDVMGQQEGDVEGQQSDIEVDMKRMTVTVMKMVEKVTQTMKLLGMATVRSTLSTVE
jgi:hypothetical protein